MLNVLVFPSSNEPGLEVVQALAKSNKVAVIGGSSFEREYDPSRLLLAEHLDCPALGEPGFRQEFTAILQDRAIDMVFPTVDAVVAEFASWEAGPTRFVVPSLSKAQLLQSKSATYDALQGVVPLPEVLREGAVEYPAYAKPDRGSGSRGGFVVESEEHLRLARRGDLMVQEYLPGPEYTVDCLSDLNGNLMFASARVRGRVGRGISLGTQVVPDPAIEESVSRIAARLSIEGPWFAQFKRDREGRATLMEVNARVAGSSTLTRLAGVNIPLISTFLYQGYRVEVPRPLTGVRINRFLRNAGEVDDFDWLIWDLDDTLVRADGKPDPEVVSRLFDFHNQGHQQVLVTRNVDPQAVLSASKIPPLFVEVTRTDDKIAGIEAAIARHGIDERRCVVVNDSVSENLLLEKRRPELRIVMPGGLDVLARERVR